MRTFKPKETPESKAKAKFRTTAKWKNFRTKLKKERKVDFVTGKNLVKGFQLHHADMALGHYANLVEENFYTLNKTTHEVVHWLFRYCWEFALINLVKILMKMDKLNHKAKTANELKMDKCYEQLIEISERIKSETDDSGEQFLLKF